MPNNRSTINRLKLLSKLFRKQDAEKVAPHTAVFLSRAVKKELIHRINRGNYINSFLYGFPGVEEVACFLRPPSYISCEWALNYHGITLQVPQVCSVVTLSTAVGKTRSIDYQGITIEFSRISPTLFNGFFFYDGIYMASQEKALLDTLYLHGRLPTEDELETDEINYRKLFKLSESFPSSIHKYIKDRWMRSEA